MTVDRPPQQLAILADVRSDAWIHAQISSTSAGTARYGADGRARWPLLLVVCVAHLIGLALLASAVTRSASVRRPAPLRITLVPLDRAPPPAPAKQEPTHQVERETPPPIIAATPVAPMAASAPVLVVPAPLLLPSTPSPEPASPAAVTAPPAPLIPPDGQAATLHNPAPIYPLEARRRRQQGTVRLRVTVSVEGRVQDIAVARTSGFDLLDQAALDAVRRWTFVPGSRAGVPVEAVGSLAIPFKLV